MYKFLSFFMGTLTAVMILFNGQLSKGLGNEVSSVFIHLTGLVAITGLLFIFKIDPRIKGVPVYLLTGGLIGYLTVLFTNLSFLALGVSLTTVLALLGQTVTALITDHCAIMGSPKAPITHSKLFSLALLTLGVWLIAK